MFYEGKVSARLRCHAAPGRMEYTIETDAVGPMQKVMAQTCDQAFVQSISQSMRAALAMKEDAEQLMELSRLLSGAVLPAGFEAPLAPDQHIILETREQFVPWELLSGAHGLLSARYLIGRTLPCAGGAHTRETAKGQPHRALLIVNPTGDLPMAETESVRLLRLFAKEGIQVDCLCGEYATLADVSLLLNKGCYQFIHYCGHVQKDERGLSMVLARGELLRAETIATFTPGNAVVFLNGCASGTTQAEDAAPEGGSLGLVDPFSLAGALCIIGATVDIRDDVAAAFADQFYPLLLGGVPVGRALRQARDQVVREPGKMGAMAYTLFGNPNTIYLPDLLYEALNAARIMDKLDLSRLDGDVRALLLEALRLAEASQAGLAHLALASRTLNATRKTAETEGYDMETLEVKPKAASAPIFDADAAMLLVAALAPDGPAEDAALAVVSCALAMLHEQGLLQKRISAVRRQDVDAVSWGAFCLSCVLFSDQVISTYSYSLCLAMIRKSRFSMMISECGGDLPNVPPNVLESIDELVIDALPRELFSPNMFETIARCVKKGEAGEQAVVRELLANSGYSMHKVLASLNVNMDVLRRMYGVEGGGGNVEP